VAKVLLKHLAQTYPNGCQAVRDLNLEIADGELLVIVGPSGCGKSTTLRIVAGLEEPACGEIWIGDRMMNGISASSRDVAMVFQNFALYPHLSVYQNMAFGLKMRGTPAAEIEKRVRYAAANLSIEPLLERFPRELSGGERQRVALGRAIVREPNVFLLDEPLSNLDAHLRVQMRAEIARLHARLRATIIYVTHDQEEAMTLGQRIAVMDRGIVQQVDTPLDIYRRPANRFVASFIGSPAMNFIRGQVENGVFRFAEVAVQGGGAAVATISAGTTAVGPAVLGVRPEDFVVALPAASRAAPSPPPLGGPAANGSHVGEVTLDVVEHLGHETIAHFALAGGTHVARLAADAGVRPGDRLALSIRPGAHHLFSEADGRRLD
jgi:multiple sugar transport system ATP-binding protein